jgi:peptide chain release factor subunit 1
MQTNQLTDDTLQTLSEVEADEPVVVSLFFNLDPQTFAAPPARESQVNSLMSDLDALIDDEGISRDARESLRTDRERVEAFLREDPDVEGAGALAVYASHALDAFTAIKLPHPVDSAVAIDQWPLLEPVVGLQDERDWCVLLVTRESARIFRGGPTALREINDIHTDVKNQHSKGGWSQARYERGVEQEVEWHLERATDLLLRQYKRRPFGHLVIGANNESLRPALTNETHAYLTERIRGWIDIDERLASPEEVLEAVRGVMDEHLAQAEQELFARFNQELATAGQAAEGVEDVLAALVERKVETLIVRENAEAPGVKCVTCGWIGPKGPQTCPVDETTLDAVENIVEPAIQAAIQQAATVHLIRESYGAEPPFSAPIAAVLRY